MQASEKTNSLPVSVNGAKIQREASCKISVVEERCGRFCSSKINSPNFMYVPDGGTRSSGT